MVRSSIDLADSNPVMHITTYQRSLQPFFTIYLFLEPFLKKRWIRFQMEVLRYNTLFNSMGILLAKHSSWKLDLLLQYKMLLSFIKYLYQLFIENYEFFSRCHFLWALNFWSLRHNMDSVKKFMRESAIIQIHVFCWACDCGDKQIYWISQDIIHHTFHITFMT